MSFQISKSNSYCVAGKHYSEPKNVAGEITINKKTTKKVKLSVGKCVICDRKKSMFVSDNTIKGEALPDFFNSLGKSSVKVG